VVCLTSSPCLFSKRPVGRRNSMLSRLEPAQIPNVRQCPKTHISIAGVTTDVNQDLRCPMLLRHRESTGALCFDREDWPKGDYQGPVQRVLSLVLASSPVPQFHCVCWKPYDRAVRNSTSGPFSSQAFRYSRTKVSFGQMLKPGELVQDVPSVKIKKAVSAMTFRDDKRTILHG
jgi:hypothetical protein